MTSQRAQAIGAALSAFDAGELDVVGLQSRLESIAATLDSSTPAVVEALRDAEAALERVVFGIRRDQQRAAALDALARLRSLVDLSAPDA